MQIRAQANVESFIELVPGCFPSSRPFVHHSFEIRKLQKPTCHARRNDCPRGSQGVASSTPSTTSDAPILPSTGHGTKVRRHADRPDIGRAAFALRRVAHPARIARAGADDGGAACRTYGVAARGGGA